ncbi:MAG: hypothetical protein AAFY46_14300 [Planctomycetota bacterium]
MSEANPVDRKQFPLGRLLFTGGPTALVVVIAFSFHRLFEGSRATFGAIDNPTATPIALPGPGEYILTRAEGISDDRSITATINTPTTPPASLEFISNDGTGYFTVDSQTNQILGGFIAPHAGTFAITANAAAYPVVVRRNPIAWAISCAKLAAILGTIAAAVMATGAFIAINRFNANQRRSHEAFQNLVQ